MLVGALCLLGSVALAAPPPTVRPDTVNRDAPEISRSTGEPGEIIVFWPRVVPRTSDPAIQAIAGQAQQQMVAALKEAHPGVNLDIRPAPERVCPRAGCNAPTMGTLLVHQGQACVAVALLSGPGQSPAMLQPWAGAVTLKASSVPFREPPESQIQITDFARCSDVPQLMMQGRGQILPWLAGLAPAPHPPRPPRPPQPTLPPTQPIPPG